MPLDLSPKGSVMEGIGKDGGVRDGRIKPSILFRFLLGERKANGSLVGIVAVLVGVEKLASISVITPSVTTT